MIKQFVIELEEYDELVVVSWSESEHDYIVSCPEPLPLCIMHSVLTKIERVIIAGD